MYCHHLSALCFLSAALATPTSLVTRGQDQLVTRVDSSLDSRATAASHVIGVNAGPLDTQHAGSLVTRQDGDLVTRAVIDAAAAAQAQAFDKTATRLFESVTIQSSSGLCLSIDPNGGDSRQNLIPIRLVPCADAANEKFDIITKGKHNDGTHKDGVLVVSSLMNGCISFDGRRAKGDKVNMFSCGGRADGSGGTDLGQLVTFDGAQDRRNMTITFAPLSEQGRVCDKGGRRSGRLVAGTCNGKLSRKFKVLLI